MKRIFNFLKIPEVWLIAIIILGFWVRLYKIDNPIADWHSWRQADTAAVSRNFYKQTLSLLQGKNFGPVEFVSMVFYPRYDDMSGVAEKPLPNKERYRFVEFPINNLVIYFAYLLNGGVDEKLARLVSVFFSLGSIVFIYFIARKYFGKFNGLLSALLFALLPYNIYFSRVVLPEPSLVFFSLGMFYFIDLWILRNTKKLFFLSLFFMICAFLTKPVAIFYLLPLLYSFYQKEKRWWPIPKRYFLLIFLGILPLIFWRIWILQHPEGIPASNWLLNGNHIRFKPAFWRWIIQDRFGREILTAAGTVLFFVGFLKKPDPKEGYLLHLLMFSSFLYLIVVATGNVQHDYYQTLIVPALVIFCARGFTQLLSGIPGFLPRIVTIPLALIFLPLMLYVGWIEVRGLYQINNPVIVEAGKYADKVLSKDAVVVAPYQGDTAFLYQTNRPGWSVVGYPTKDLIDMFGVTNYVSVNYDGKTKWLMKKYTIIEANPKFVILDLKHENPDFYKNAKSQEELKEPS